jgi:hypothetical protein
MEQDNKQETDVKNDINGTAPVNDHLEAKVIYKLILGFLLFAAAGFFMYIFITHL